MIPNRTFENMAQFKYFGKTISISIGCLHDLVKNLWNVNKWMNEWMNEWMNDSKKSKFESGGS
jgi:hypothetical protein